MATSFDRTLYSAIAKNDWSTARWVAGQNKGLQYIHTDGNTMLHLAAKGRNEQLVKILLEKGADPSSINNFGQTVVFLAADNCVSPSLMEKLLDAGGDVNRQDNQGWTPLVAATYRNASPELILLLLERGADKGHVVAGGKRAMDFAKDKPKTFDQPDLVEILSNPSDGLIRPSSVRPIAIPAAFHVGRASASSTVSTVSSVRSEGAHSVSTVKTEHVVVVISNRDEEDTETGQVDDEESKNEEEGLPATAAIVPETPMTERPCVFVGYSPGDRPDYADRARVSQIVQALQARGINVFADLGGENSVSQAKMFQVSKELARASVFVACVSQEYMYRVFAGSMESAYFDVCAQEFTDAVNTLGDEHVIPVVLDPRLLDNRSWKGPVGLILHNRPQVNFSNDDLLQAAVDDLARMISDLV